MRTIVLSLLLAGLAATAAPAQVGAPLPKAKLTDFSQSKAKKYDDLVGRLVVLEFFAHW